MRQSFADKIGLNSTNGMSPMKSALTRQIFILYYIKIILIFLDGFILIYGPYDMILYGYFVTSLDD